MHMVANSTPVQEKWSKVSIGNNGEKKEYYR